MKNNRVVEEVKYMVAFDVTLAYKIYFSNILHVIDLTFAIVSGQ